MDVKITILSIAYCGENSSREISEPCLSSEGAGQRDVKCFFFLSGLIKIAKNLIGYAKHLPILNYACARILKYENDILHLLTLFGKEHVVSMQTKRIRASYNAASAPYSVTKVVRLMISRSV